MQGRKKKQYEENWWMIEKAFKCFLASISFYFIFRVIDLFFV